MLDADVNLKMAQAYEQAFSKLNAEFKVGFAINFYQLDASVFNEQQAHDTR